MLVAVNLLAGMRLPRGRVVLVSSGSALNLLVEMMEYSVTKTAVLGSSRGLAKRTAGTNVRVNAVLPGPTLSEDVARMLEGGRTGGESIEEVASAFVRQTRPSSIRQRTTTPDQIANLVAFFFALVRNHRCGIAGRWRCCRFVA